MISDTSALVLLWTQGTIHTSRNSKTYLNSLDLEPGRELLTKCNKIWIHYDQVIKNRKKCILDLVLSEINKKAISQVVIFGAGWDALSVELLSKTNNLQIYELDTANMNEKKVLLKNTDEKLINSIHCIRSNLSNPLQVYNQLKNNGWDSTKPSILVFEGISYYLSQANLSGLIQRFKSECQNVLILEYLRYNRSKNTADDVFDTIKNQTGIKIIKYDTGLLKSYLEKIGGVVIKNYSLQEMEENRLGCSFYFKHRDWINLFHVII